MMGSKFLSLVVHVSGAVDYHQTQQQQPAVLSGQGPANTQVTDHLTGGYNDGGWKQHDLQQQPMQDHMSNVAPQQTFPTVSEFTSFS